LRTANYQWQPDRQIHRLQRIHILLTALHSISAVYLYRPCWEAWAYNWKIGQQPL
jgi:hypothetical protein